MSRMVRTSDQVEIVNHLVIADRYWSRLVGLMGRRFLPRGEGLLLTRSNSIHMWFMRIPIDVVFLEKIDTQSWRVKKLALGLRPWKLLPVGCMSATDTLELPIQTIQKSNLQVGEVLCTTS